MSGSAAHRLRNATVPGLMLTLLIAGCQSHPGTFSNPGVTSQISYTRPPASGRVVNPQARLVLCNTVAGARSMAATGLFAQGCVPLGKRTGFRVIARQHQQLDEGGVWMLEVQNPAGTRRFWIPVPWHDWS